VRDFYNNGGVDHHGGDHHGGVGLLWLCGLVGRRIITVRDTLALWLGWTLSYHDM
jgi:hypothetical protein